jgi:hypothetical protein
MSTNNEHNDINDPVVQDVLNEFRDELLISKNNKDMINTPPLTIQDIPNPSHQPHPSHQPSYPPHLQQPPHSQYSSPHSPHSQPPYSPPHSQHPPHPPHLPHQYPSPNSQHSPQQPPYSSYSQMNKNDYMLYMDIELIKKNLIIVIIVFLIYFSGIINNLYDRIPEYLQENIMPLDVYIKTGLLFIILYVISYAGYV